MQFLNHLLKFLQGYKLQLHHLILHLNQEAILVYQKVHLYHHQLMLLDLMEKQLQNYYQHY